MSLSEYAHAELFANNPFVDVAIWVAGMITEPSEISLLSSIDKLAFTQGHEIEMLDAFFIVGMHAPTKGGLSNNLANILKYEVSRLEIRISTQPKTFLLSLDYRHVGIEATCEALVLTLCSTAAVVHTLHLGDSIDAVRTFAAGIVAMGGRV